MFLNFNLGMEANKNKNRNSLGDKKSIKDKVKKVKKSYGPYSPNHPPICTVHMRYAFHNLGSSGSKPVVAVGFSDMAIRTFDAG